MDISSRSSSSFILSRINAGNQFSSVSIPFAASSCNSIGKCIDLKRGSWAHCCVDCFILPVFLTTLFKCDSILDGLMNAMRDLTGEGVRNRSEEFAWIVETDIRAMQISNISDAKTSSGLHDNAFNYFLKVIKYLVQKVQRGVSIILEQFDCGKS